MSAHPTQAQREDAPGQQAADTQFYREALHDFITIGTSLARHLHQQVTGQPEATPPATQPAPTPPAAITPEAAAMAFDRLARSVRRSIMLARKLAEPPAPAKDPAHHRAAARKRIIREVEDAIQRHSHATDSADDADPASLTTELHDRLDTPDLDRDLTTRPIADIVTELCRDLGLAALPGTNPWRRRTPQDIRDLNARAAAQPGAAPPSPRPAPKPPSPNPQPPRAAVPRAHPDPTQTGHQPDAAEIAAILRTYAQPRWRPPPGA